MARVAAARIRFEYNFDATNGRGVANAYLENDFGWSNLAATCLFDVEVPGKPNTAPQRNVQSGRRRAFLYIHRLDNYATQDPILSGVLTPDDKQLVRGLAHRLLCLVVRKLLDDEFLTRFSLMILVRGDDKPDQKLEDYYKKIGFESYSTHQYGYDKNELFPYRHFESMEVPVGKFLLKCNPDAATHSRRKAAKTKKKPRKRTANKMIARTQRRRLPFLAL